MKPFSQDSRSPRRDLNPGPPEYEAGMLTTRPQRSVQGTNEEGEVALGTTCIYKGWPLYMLLLLREVESLKTHYHDNASVYGCRYDHYEKHTA
jgi:hypothetical protein